MIEAGTYEAVAVEGGLGRAGTGTVQLALRFELTREPNAGRSVTWYGAVTENAIERTAKSGQDAGWDWVKRELVRAPPKVMLVIEVEEKPDGKEVNRVAFINTKPALLIRDPLNDTAAAKVTQYALNVLGGKPAKAVADAPPSADDDIPF